MNKLTRDTHRCQTVECCEENAYSQPERQFLCDCGAGPMSETGANLHTQAPEWLARNGRTYRHDLSETRPFGCCKDNGCHACEESNPCSLNRGIGGD